MKKIDSIPYFWRRLPLLAPLLAVVFAFMLVVPAWAEVIGNSNFPVTASMENPCNRSLQLTLSGTIHTITRVTLINNSDSANVGVNSTERLSGTDNEGNSYVANDTQNAQLSLPTRRESTFTEHFPVISKGGSAPSFTLQILFHMTINPDGTTTAYVDTFTSTCP